MSQECGVFGYCVGQVVPYSRNLSGESLRNNHGQCYLRSLQSMCRYIFPKVKLEAPPCPLINTFQPVNFVQILNSTDFNLIWLRTIFLPREKSTGQRQNLSEFFIYLHPSSSSPATFLLSLPPLFFIFILQRITV